MLPDDESSQHGHEMSHIWEEISRRNTARPRGGFLFVRAVITLWLQCPCIRLDNKAGTLWEQHSRIIVCILPNVQHS